MTSSNFQASREWWSQRWLDLLDSYRFKKRLERARNYARQGNILSIKFEASKVLAQVQGTEPEPYKVSLFLEPFSDEQWSYVIETMSKQAIWAAKLLAGEMPQNMEQVFTANGLSLFPFTLSEVRSKCSCPDKANPCKHIGAVYYQLGDRFSEDPFVLFELRGRTKDEIIASLREFRTRGAGEQRGYGAMVQEERTQQGEQGKQGEQGEKSQSKIRLGKFGGTETDTATRGATTGGTPATHPLNFPQNLKSKIALAPSPSFWQYNEPLDASLVVITPSPSSDTVLDILGAIPIAELDTQPTTKNNSQPETNAEVVKQYLDNVYQQTSQQAVLTAMNTEMG